MFDIETRCQIASLWKHRECYYWLVHLTSPWGMTTSQALRFLRVRMNFTEASIAWAVAWWTIPYGSAGIGG